MPDSNQTKSSLTWAQVALAALSVLKEALVTFMAFLVQYERIKGKKIEDQVELMKADKRAEDEIKDIQLKADATTARAGIDEFLQSRNRDGAGQGAQPRP